MSDAERLLRQQLATAVEALDIAILLHQESGGVVNNQRCEVRRIRDKLKALKLRQKYLRKRK